MLVLPSVCQSVCVCLSVSLSVCLSVCVLCCCRSLYLHLAAKLTANTHCAITEGSGKLPAAPSVHDGWGWGSQTGSHGGPPGGSSMEGWDDMDPMAVLSQSVQFRARAYDSDSTIPAQQLNAQTPATQPSPTAARLSAGAAHEDQNRSTQSDNDTSTVCNHTFPGEEEYRPARSDSQTDNQCKSSDWHDQHQGTVSAQQQHVADNDPNNRVSVPSQAAAAEKHSSASGDAHHSPTPLRYRSQQGAMSIAPPDFYMHWDADHDSVNVTHPGNLGGSMHVKAAALTAESSLTDVQSMLGLGDRAMIHTRAPGRDAFGPTMVYGYPGVVFEATQAGRIATVTVFKV